MTRGMRSLVDAGERREDYTRAMLEEAFRDFRDMKIVEEEIEIYEGTSHGGMSAVINLTARK